MAKTGESYIKSRERRLFDIAGATCLASAGSPIAVVAAAALCLESGSLRPFFKQHRVGVDEQLFTIFKFRTINYHGDPDNVTTFGANDPRATKVGRILRIAAMDEYPQALNVLKGQMSLVGQRPQIESVREQRKSVLTPELWREWCYFGGLRMGIFGRGQELAHKLDRYAEDNPTAITLITKADIKSERKASLVSDLEIVAGTPLRLAWHRVKGQADQFVA